MKTKLKSVETELLEITSAKPRKSKEDEQDYLARLCKAGNDDITDDDWEKLSQAAQGWLNEAARALKAEKSLPPVPGDVASDDEEETAPAEEANADEEDPEEEEEKPLKSTLKKTKTAKVDADEEDPPSEDEDPEEEEAAEEEEEGKPAKAAKEPKAKKEKKVKAPEDGDKSPKEKKKRGPRGTGGGTAFLRHAVVEDPDISRDDLVAAALKAGFTISPRTADIVIESTVKTIEILKKKGLLRAS